MARAKNRGYQQSFSPSYTIRRWRLGIYIRLSKEDLKKGKDDSNSVKNQRDLLNDFYRRNIDEFESITEYVDDPTKECLQFLYVTVIEVLQSVKNVDTVGFIPGTGKEFLRGYAEVFTDAQKFVH